MKRVLSLILAAVMVVSMFAGLQLTASAWSYVQIGIGTHVQKDSDDIYVFVPEKSGAYLISTDKCGSIYGLLGEYDEMGDYYEGAYLDDGYLFENLEAGMTYRIKSSFNTNWDTYDETDDSYDDYTSFTVTDIKYIGDKHYKIVESIIFNDLEPVHFGDAVSPIDLSIKEVKSNKDPSCTPNVVKITDCFLADVSESDKYSPSFYAYEPDWDNLTKTSDQYLKGRYYLVAKLQLQSNESYDYIFGSFLYTDNPFHHWGNYGTNIKELSLNEAYIAIEVEAFEYIDPQSGIKYSFNYIDPQGESESTLNEDKGFTALALPESFSGNELSIPESLTVNNEKISVTSIALKDNDTVQKVNLPKTVTRIVYGGFANYASLKDVELPEKLDKIERSAFSDCTSLEEIKVNSANEHFTSQDGVVYNSDKTELVRYPAGKKDETFTVPNTVKTIEVGAFATSANTKQVIIPNTVEKINEYAFYASKVENVQLSNKIKSIECDTFEGAEKLKSIVIPEGIERIKYNAFQLCTSLESIYIPRSLKTIDAAFGGVENLKDIYYAGSEDEWNQISIYHNDDWDDWDDDNECLRTATVHYNVEPELPHEHSWGAGVVTTEATCTEPGIKTFTCECGQSRTETISALGHEMTFQSAKAETCTQTGNEAYYECSRCHNYYSDDKGANLISDKASVVIPALGHDFSDNAEVCRNGCGTANPDYIPPVPAHVHDYQEVVTAPKANAFGYTQYKCACGEWQTDESGEVIKDNYTSPTGKVTGLKCTARTAAAMKFTWKKVAGVRGYQVQLINAKGAQAGLKTLHENVYTFTKLASGHAYKARVRLYVKDADGNYYFGPWSAVLNSPTLPKGTALTGLARAKKAFTAKWKKGACTGYQLQFGRKSNFKGAKTVTFKNVKTVKYTAKKLAANKYYFVRIRTYKKIAGKNYFSAWSKTYKVKTK